MEVKRRTRRARLGNTYSLCHFGRKVRAAGCSRLGSDSLAMGLLQTPAPTTAPGGKTSTTEGVFRRAVSKSGTCYAVGKDPQKGFPGSGSRGPGSVRVGFAHRSSFFTS